MLTPALKKEQQTSRIFYSVDKRSETCLNFKAHFTKAFPSITKDLNITKVVF